MEPIDNFCSIFEFKLVAFLELAPLCRIMGVPFSEIGAGRYVLTPLVDGGIFLFDSPGPEAIYEDTLAVTRRHLVINSFDLYHSPSKLKVNILPAIYLNLSSFY